MSLLPSTKDITPGDPMADYVNALKAWDRDAHEQYFVRFHEDPGLSQVMLAKNSTQRTLMVYQDHGAYNLIYGMVFSAIPTCLVMPISRRADEDKTKRDDNASERALLGGPV